jgi:hypothetical protein
MQEIYKKCFFSGDPKGIYAQHYACNPKDNKPHETVIYERSFLETLKAMFSFSD